MVLSIRVTTLHAYARKWLRDTVMLFLAYGLAPLRVMDSGPSPRHSATPRPVDDVHGNQGRRSYGDGSGDSKMAHVVVACAYSLPSGPTILASDVPT